MTGVLSAFARALGQLGDRRVLGVLTKSMGVTLAIFAVLGLAAWQGLSAVIQAYVDVKRPADYQLLAELTAIALVVIGGWLLFRVVALAVLQFFADDVVLAVEARHYPEAAATARKLPLAEEVRNSARGVLRAVLVNLIALPFALLLLVTGFGTALLFWAVNAWLLGRELHDMVWLRHRAGPEGLPSLPRLTRLALGGIVSAMLLIPFVNLLAPVLGAAAATHLVHGRRRRA